MKFTAPAFLSFVTACLAVTQSAASTLEKRAPTPLTSELDRPNTFYRAVTGYDLARMDNYPLHGHVTKYMHTPGDFSSDGGLYVFHSMDDAVLWGDSYQKVFPGGGKKWNLIEFHYEPPHHKLDTKLFPVADDEWKHFVNGCDEHKCAHNYDIVEGPISTNSGAKRQAYLEGGTNYVFQAVFITTEALETLTVGKITERNVPGSPKKCPFCTLV